jgi:putative membrane-bound dehydrogenase-like protein
MKYEFTLAATLAALAVPLFTQAAEEEAAPPAPQVPPGFSIELVAGPPLVERPVTATFDDEGRLYVAESSGSNDPVEKQLELRPHRIVRLEDADGDGRFDKRLVFAEGMMFPAGTMWLDGSLYVAAPPSIWKLTDRDGDGVADERVEWFQGKTLTGCANDLHGPYLGPDGWIYWTKGALPSRRMKCTASRLPVGRRIFTAPDPTAAAWSP